MSSRRYPTAELYEERERDFYRGGNRSHANYDELDLELRRGSDPRRSAPDFFREDYNRPTAGPLVVRSREDELSRAGPRSARGGFDDDARSIRSSRPPPPPASSIHHAASSISHSHHDAPPRRATRDFERDETDIRISRREQSRPRMPAPEPELRAVEREDIIFRRGDGAPPARPREVDFDEDVRFRGRGRQDGIDIHASRSEVSRHGRDVSAERGSIRFQERDGNFEVRTKHSEFNRDGRDTSRERSSVTIRGREKSLPPPRSRGELVAREHEEFTIRRRDTSPQRPDVIQDEIIIRRKEERMPSPSPSPPPAPAPPPPPLEPEIRPPIIQEIITHHRHIDHGKLGLHIFSFVANLYSGVERARSPTPPPMPSPPSPPRAVNETLEIDIRRRESRSRGPGRGREYEDLNLEIDINRENGK
jgi:hypothetical protein